MLVRQCCLFLWIPVTPVITAFGCNDWGDENDGGGVSHPRRRLGTTGCRL